MTGEHISRIVELREMLPAFQAGFNFVNATVLCAILEMSTNNQKQTKQQQKSKTNTVCLIGRL